MSRTSTVRVRSVFLFFIWVLFSLVKPYYLSAAQSSLRPYPADPSLKTFEGYNKVHAVNAPLFSCVEKNAQVYFQSLFIPRRETRWEGDIRKFVFGDDGVFRRIWSAREKMADRQANRRILTARVFDEDAECDMSNLPLVPPNLAEFACDGNEVLWRRIGFSDVSAGETFLRWYCEPPLFDTVRGGVVLAGQPRKEPESDDAHAAFALKDKTVSRRTVLYVQSNGGALHALEENTGVELWAFVPPNVLEGRLRGLKLWNVRHGSSYSFDEFDEIAPESYESSPRFLLDGPLVAEDVLVRGEYVTFLLGFLGRGGEGMYAMDVTAPYAPRFLWALENAHYRGEEGTTYFWRSVDESVERTAESGSGRSWRMLGMTTGTSFIGFHPSAGWIFLTGNGSSGEYGERFKGSVYVGRVEDGSMVRELEAPADSGSFACPVAVLREEGGMRRRISFFFAADSKGRIYEGNLSSLSPSEWSLREVARLRESAAPSYSMEAGRLRGEKWLFIGAGASEEQGSACGYAFLEAINLENTSRGWWVRLDENIEAGQTQFLASPPVLANGVLFFSTVVRGSSGEVYESRVYALKGSDGLPVRTSGKGYVSFRNIILSGISLSGGRLITSVFGGALAAETVFADELTFTVAGGNMLSIAVSDMIPGIETETRKRGASLFWRFP